MIKSATCSCICDENSAGNYDLELPTCNKADGSIDFIRGPLNTMTNVTWTMLPLGSSITLNVASTRLNYNNLLPGIYTCVVKVVEIGTDGLLCSIEHDIEVGCECDTDSDDALSINVDYRIGVLNY